MTIKTSWAAAAGLALAFGGLALLAMAAGTPADGTVAKGPVITIPASPAANP